MRVQTDERLAVSHISNLMWVVSSSGTVWVKKAAPMVDSLDDQPCRHRKMTDPRGKWAIKHAMR